MASSSEIRAAEAKQWLWLSDELDRMAGEANSREDYDRAARLANASGISFREAVKAQDEAVSAERAEAQASETRA